MTVCEILLNSSLLIHSSSQEQDSYIQALITECGFHDDGGNKNFRNACALISDHFATTS